MNQNSRQNAENSIEKDFHKFMNNSSFGYDARNHLDNCQVVPIFEELKEITYLKRYYNYFHSKVSRFVSSQLMRLEIKGKFNMKMKLSKDKFYEIKFSTLNAEKNEFLEAAENFEKKNSL